MPFRAASRSVITPWDVLTIAIPSPPITRGRPARPRYARRPGLEIRRRPEIVRCFQDGCYAEVILEKPLLDTLKTGTSATFIVFQTPEEGIGIPVDIKGFADGFAALP